MLEVLEGGLCQWYSNPLSNLNVNAAVKGRTYFDNFRRTCFLPGWEVPRSLTEVRYCDAAQIQKLGPEQIPFTVDMKDIRPYIFLWKVKLTKNGTFQIRTLAWIEQECRRQDEIQAISAAGR